MSLHYALPLENPLESYHIASHTYKVIEGHEILVDVLIPKKLISLGPDSEGWKAKRPVSVRIHGGGLVTGRRTDPSYVPRWLYSLAHAHGAIVVSPDYRLLPEATAEELLDDLDDFWAWLATDLARVVREESVRLFEAPGGENLKGLEVDLERVMVHGESAGGYCALQMVLSNFRPSRPGAARVLARLESPPRSPSRPRIRALVAAYPMCDFRHRHWTEAYLKDVSGAPQLPASTLDEHFASIRGPSLAPRPVLSNCAYSNPRGMLFLAAVQQGRLSELLGPSRVRADDGRWRVHVEDRIADGARLPPTVIVHGTADSGVPVECADRLVALIKEHRAVEEEMLMYARVDDKEHGFDLDLEPGDEEWTRKAVDFVEKVWLVDE